MSVWPRITKLLRKASSNKYSDKKQQMGKKQLREETDYIKAKKKNLKKTNKKTIINILKEITEHTSSIK